MTLPTPAQRLEELCFGPIDAIRLDAFRFALGLSLLVYMAARWRWAAEWLGDESFHISRFAFQPFETPPLPPLPVIWLPAFGLLLFAAVFAFIGGYCERPTAILLAGSLVYISLVDRISSFTLNKLFIVSLLVLAAAPPPVGDPRDGGATQLRMAWPVRILQATLSLHYFTAGWCKAVHGDWLVDPYALWSHAQGVYRTELAGWLLYALPLKAWAFLQAGALAFELGAPLLFLPRRLRGFAILSGCTFHLTVALLMDRLIHFSLQMCCFYLLFVEARSLHSLVRGARSWAARIGAGWLSRSLVP